MARTSEWSGEDRTPGGPVVLFDGFCNLCSRSVDFIIRRDPHGTFLFSSLQSVEARKLLSQFGAEADTFDSIVLIHGDRVITHSDAVIEVARRLGFPWRLFGAARFFPRPLRDGLYRWMAKNRYRWFGRRATCRIPSAAEAARFLPSDGEAGSAHSGSGSDAPDCSSSK